MTQIVQKLGKTQFWALKSDIFREIFFRPFFRPKNSKKLSKKWKIWKIAENDPNRSKIGWNQFWALKNDPFRENFFSPIFQTKKLGKIFENNEKFQKLPKMAQILKTFEKCPKSFRNWVKPILGTKKWYFPRKFFFAHFSDQKTRKNFKKMKNFKNCQKWPKF